MASSTAAGTGAAAAAVINGTAGSSSTTPKPPDGPPSGRPQPRKDGKEDSPEEDMWRGLLQGVAGAEQSGKAFQRCVTLAARLQSGSLELAAAGRDANLGEADLKRLAAENLFRPCPNPQDGARVASTQPESDKSAPAAAAEAPAAEANAEPPMTRSEEANQPIPHRKSIAHMTTEMAARRKSMKMTCAGGAAVSKHMHGSPTVVYDVGMQVGEGTFGKVTKARHKQTGQIHAVKAVPKEKVNPDELWAEINIMKQLDHPHIMRLYYTFEDDVTIYMASEMCAGGELFDTIDEAGFLTERCCSLLALQILGAVNYLHCKSICHRDIKPENFLVLKKVDFDLLQLKMIDFGTARRFDTGLMVTKVCTAHYVAPEVLKRGAVPYTEKVDVWSCGVVLYMMLCGFMPFHHEDNMEMLKLVKKGKYTFKPDKVWKLISEDAKNLVASMMCVKVADRFTALQCVQHTWITTKSSQTETSSVDEAIVRQMRRFLTNNRLKRVALQIIARQIKDDSITRLRNIFLGIDEDCSGCLTLEEMTEALKELDLSESSQQEMAQILVCVDQDQSGTIEWTEFLAATLTKEQYLQEDVCKGAFYILDVDEDGVLNKNDLMAFMTSEIERNDASLGVAALVEINQIMMETDENDDGSVSFSEFMALMADEQPRNAESACAIRYKRGGEKERASVLKGGLRSKKNRGTAEAGAVAEEGEEEYEDDEEEGSDFGDDNPADRSKNKEAQKDPHEGWLLQSQKAWELYGKKCTLTIYQRKDQALLQFEVHFIESGENLTATGGKDDFEQLCKEKEATGLNGPAATFAAIREILGCTGEEPSKSAAPA